jgi:hypothetical protein
LPPVARLLVLASSSADFVAAVALKIFLLLFPYLPIMAGLAVERPVDKNLEAPDQI